MTSYGGKSVTGSKIRVTSSSALIAGPATALRLMDLWSVTVAQNARAADTAGDRIVRASKATLPSHQSPSASRRREHVGHHSLQTDEVETVLVAISDGIDAGIGYGNTFRFRYSNEAA